MLYTCGKSAKAQILTGVISIAWKKKLPEISIVFEHSWTKFTDFRKLPRSQNIPEVVIFLLFRWTLAFVTTEELISFLKTSVGFIFLPTFFPLGFFWGEKGGERRGVCRDSNASKAVLCAVEKKSYRSPTSSYPARLIFCVLEQSLLWCSVLIAILAHVWPGCVKMVTIGDTVNDHVYFEQC